MNSNLEVQTAESGSGPLFHRTYQIPLDVSFDVARTAMARLQVSINEFSPQILARFEKVKGHPSEMQPGDEFQIHISGPWNGPVRVKSVSETEFHLVTLDGHLEAGEIHFRVKESNDSHSVFEIESWARSRDFIVDIVYDKLKIARLAQTEMWKNFCESFFQEARKIDGRPAETDEEDELLPDVNIRTEKFDHEKGSWVEC